MYFSYDPYYAMNQDISSIFNSSTVNGHYKSAIMYVHIYIYIGFL